MNRHVLVFALMFSLGLTLSAQAPTRPSQNAVYAQCLRDLGEREALLGSLRPLHAAVIDGQLMDAQAVKARFEQANPSLEFDAKLFTVKEKEKTKGPTP